VKLICELGEGRVDIQIDANNQGLSKLFEPVLRSKTELEHNSPPSSPAWRGNQLDDHCPALNVVIQLVGSRGDIQPFLSVGLKLQAVGHRVRIATHPTFQKFVEDTGLEFFSIGGNPMELMAYMVRNAGLLPDFDNVMKGDVQRQRKAVREIIEGCWRSCIASGNGLSADTKQWRDSKPFVADAIISNPPTFAHIHCAEKLGVPLHLMFTLVHTYLPSVRCNLTYL
jgi:UDP:flavonoid glycosyltransferase YjiC (YdhE family)